YASAIGDDLPVFDLQVELRHLGDTQIAERLACRRHRVLRSILPRYLAGTDHLRHAIDAVAGGTFFGHAYLPWVSAPWHRRCLKAGLSYACDRGSAAAPTRESRSTEDPMQHAPLSAVSLLV